MNEEDVILDYHWVYLQTPKFRQTVYRADKGSTFITQSNGFYFYCTRKSKYNYRLVKESILGKSAYVLPTSFENVIECMIEDKSRNRFLLNTRTDLYELKKDTINHICNLRGNGQVEIIFLKSDSVLLLGSDLNLVELNIKTQARKILLSDVDIRDIKSYRNRIWLFAYGQGLYVLEKDKLTKVPIDNRGYLLYAHSFFLHRDSSIWITTNNGILRVSSPEIPFLSDNTEGRVHYTIYDKNSGINTELNGAGYPSWSRDSKNNYYIACADGILVFNPDSIRNNSSRKLISIKSCKINNEEIFIKDTIVINNITDKIELSIRSPRYNSENIALLYRIDGSAWRGLNNDKILISNLSLGDHKLEISDDSTGVRVNTLTLIIDRKRYWYQYTLIQLVITLFLVGLVFYIGYFKFYLVLRNKIQEQKRQKIINKILLHDIKSPINYLEQILTNLNKNNIDTDIANKELYTVIRKTTTDISSITSTLLNWIKATNNRGAAKSNLRDEINKSTNYYSLIFKKKNIIVKNSISDVWISINPVMFHIILNNIFDNVSKHGEPGLLEIERIESCKHKNTVCLRISNTGLIAPIKLNKIRKVLAGITQDIVEDSNTLGIIIISDLCKLQSYSIDISTDVDQNKTIIDLHSIKKAD
jgi:signal transduction histidine kinase